MASGPSIEPERKQRASLNFPALDAGPIPSREAELTLVRLIHGKNQNYGISDGVQISPIGNIPPSFLKSLQQAFIAEGVQLTYQADGTLVEPASLHSAAKKAEGRCLSLAAGKVEISALENDKFLLKTKLPGEAPFSIEISAKSDLSSSLAPLAQHIHASATGKQKEWYDSLRRLYDTTTAIGAKDGLVTLEKGAPVPVQALERLKRLVGNGTLDFLIETPGQEFRVLSLAKEELESLREGPLRINGRILTATIERLFMSDRVNGRALSCSPNSQWGDYRQVSGTSLPQGTETQSQSCITEDFAEKPNGQRPYRIPFLGLNSPEFDGLIVHRTYSQIRKGSPIYAWDGKHSLSEAEEKLVGEILSGGERLEKEFLISKGELVKRVLLQSEVKQGPHVLMTADPRSIRIEEDEFLRMTPNHARIVGQHEAAHLLDGSFGITSSESSRLRDQFAKLKAANEEHSHFTLVNEHSMYLLLAGHSADNPAEYFASLVNCVLHPRISEVIGRLPPFYLSDLRDGLSALKEDLLEVGFDEKRTPFFQKLNGALKAIDERQRNVSIATSTSPSLQTESR